MIILVISAVILVGIAGLVAWDLRHHQSNGATGVGRTVVQAVDGNNSKKLVDEPTFSMELPGDWKETARLNTINEHSITWQDSTKGQDNRNIKLYIDLIPTDFAVNKLLPVSVVGNGLNYGDISDNCATFTKNGTLNAGQAATLRDQAAKWQQVDFICDLDQVVQNKIGTGSTGSINSVTVTGPSKGAHKYFFVYTDHNIQPDNAPLYGAIKTFKAK
jgi:hypothetical protein